MSKVCVKIEKKSFHFIDCWTAVAKYIKSKDKFGLTKQLRIQSEENVFSSTFGGITTLLIYLTTFMYAFYLLELCWNKKLAQTVNYTSERAKTVT